MKFLELYFAGTEMKAAVLGAGFRGASDQALCNTGLRILRKFIGDPKAVFRRRAGTRGANIAQLLTEVAENNKSELQQLKTLTILSRLIGD